MAKLPTPEDTQTPFPTDVPLSKKIPNLSADDLVNIGKVLKILIDVNLGNFQKYATELDIWNAILEMRSKPMNIPWEGAAFMTKPTVFTTYQEFVSRVVGSCLVPRPYLVRGNDPVSSQYANQIEQMLNGEWEKNDCFEAYDTAIQLGARDGTVIMEVLYDLHTHEEILYADEPQFDEDGTPKVDEDGQPVKKRVPKMAKFIDYDAPREVPIDLKSFLMFPIFSRDVNKADACATKVFMSEHDMRKKVNAGIFKEDITEQILAYVQSAAGEQSQDPQGNSQYTINNRIPIVDTAVAPPPGFAMSRGPVEMWRVHTNLIDLNDDEIPEENVYWVHYASGLCPGAVPFEYYGGRPFFDLSMIPRPNTFYGFAIPEIGRSTQEEIDVQTNARLNLLDLAVRPGRYRTQGVRFRQDDKRTGPDVEVEVNSPTDFGYLSPPRIPSESFAEQQDLGAVLDRAVGAPTTAAYANNAPVGGSSQRSARAAMYQAQILGQQSNLVFTRVRRWMLKILKYKVGLYRQYGKNQIETIAQTQEGPQTVMVPQEILGLNYTFMVQGLGGAIDKESRRNDLAMLVQLLLTTPLSQLFQGDIAALWQLARMVIEAYDVADITGIIGTLDSQKAKAAAGARQQQTNALVDALMQVLSHSSSPPLKAPGSGQTNGQINGQAALAAGTL